MTNDEMRARFEAWYSIHAFDYESNPIGCRDFTLQWIGWQAALRYRDEQEKQA